MNGKLRVAGAKGMDLKLQGSLKYTVAGFLVL
jgi:hypothetical protein